MNGDHFSTRPVKDVLLQLQLAWKGQATWRSRQDTLEAGTFRIPTRVFSRLVRADKTLGSWGRCQI